MWFGIGKKCLEKNMIRISTCITNMYTAYNVFFYSKIHLKLFLVISV